MATGPNHHYKPSDQYNRLLAALGLEQNAENNLTYSAALIDLLGVRMSTISDCIRKGCVTDPVLEAAKTKGINPEFIKSGKEPVYLEGFTPIRWRE